MKNFLNTFKHKFTYGDSVISNRNEESGVIKAVRVEQESCYQEDKYLVSYYVDPTPGMESDDEFWESEVNLRMKV